MAEFDMFKDSYVIVDEVLKQSHFCKTEKVYFSLKNGQRKGPYIRKVFAEKCSEIYHLLQKEQCGNLPLVYYVDENFVIEEFIDGQPLDKAETIPEVCYEQLCNAVNFLHTHFKQPIIHRDIKPSNIMIDKDGKVKLIDFDIAREYSGEKESDTQHLGTIGYAPPEQFGFAQTDVQSDIYSLGKVLEYLGGDNKICEKACALDPKDRYASVEELLRAYKGKALFDNKILNTIGIVWNISLTAFLGFMIIATIYTLADPTSANAIKNSVPSKIIFAVLTIGFMYLPGYYILLFKPPIYRRVAWFPRLSWKQQFFMVIICFFAIFLLAMLANLF